MKNTTSLTIGISAFNEQENIKNLILSIIKQKEKKFIINEILIMSDGSTDNTVLNAKAIRDERLKILDDTNRKGKAYRINQIFQKAKGDIIVLLDADVILSSKYTLSRLIQPYLLDKNVGLVSGRAYPRKARTFIEECVNSSYRGYDRFRDKIHNGENPYSVEGRILSISRTLAKKIRIPNNMFADDNYIYFSCITKGFLYRYVKSAIAWYRSPSTLREQIRQNTRFAARDIKLKSIFGDIVDKEYSVPSKIRYEAFLIEILRNPIPCLSIFFINLISKITSRFVALNTNALWQTISTCLQVAPGQHARRRVVGRVQDDELGS